MSEKAISGRTNEPQTEKHLRCQAGHQLVAAHNKERKLTSLLPPSPPPRLPPQCTNICVTTNDKRESPFPQTSTSSTAEVGTAPAAAAAAAETANNSSNRPFSFKVITVIDPEALSTYSADYANKPGAAVHNLRSRHREYTDRIRKSILLYHTSSVSSTLSLPKRRTDRLPWRKEPSSGHRWRPIRFKLRSCCEKRGFKTNSPAAAAAAEVAAGKLVKNEGRHSDPKSSSHSNEQIRRQLLDTQSSHQQASLLQKSASLLESAVLGVGKEETDSLAARPRQKSADEEAVGAGQGAEHRVLDRSILRLVKSKKKKRKKKKLLPPEKKKVNLRKFVQKIPIVDTEYEMELYLEQEVIDRTRMGKIDSTKEPRIPVNSNKSADLRDEFSSYCSQKKKLKNWLYYA